MSAPTYASLVAPLREAAVQAAWVQWSGISFGAAAQGKSAQAVVDPDALVLASLAFESDLRRFGKVLHIWLRSGVRLLSTARISNLVRDYPQAMRGKLASLAADAVALGDARWRRLAGKAKGSGRVERAVAEPVTPNLRLPCAMMLRLRLALGVGIKADAMTFLLGSAHRATVRQVAQGTGYADRAVRRAVEDLVAARFVDTVPTSPVSYAVPSQRWYPLLGVDDNTVPLWRWWHEVYVIARALVDWGEQADAAGWTRYVAGSRLRDVFERLTPLTSRAYVREHPDWSAAPDTWLEGPQPWVKELVELMRAML